VRQAQRLLPAKAIRLGNLSPRLVTGGPSRCRWQREGWAPRGQRHRGRPQEWPMKPMCRGISGVCRMAIARAIPTTLPVAGLAPGRERHAKALRCLTAAAGSTVALVLARARRKAWSAAARRDGSMVGTAQRPFKIGASYVRSSGMCSSCSAKAGHSRTAEHTRQGMAVQTADLVPRA
jgi:hypothetical protein